jgi:hypothetical protein
LPIFIFKEKPFFLQLQVSKDNYGHKKAKPKPTMKLAIVASLVAGAAAFAPSIKPAASTALFGYEGELGVIVSYFKRGLFDILCCLPTNSIFIK